ncbi:hypothetical protein [Nocardioides marmoriginsengisoli]|uniref:hypothetical protein n=1 Tax=Nocardioides marmoriginsengisoli TaxID=661483 RepID=UPI0011CDB9C1|nr:hypothetical protein [Nocardioides marmoriginsengisoli]
MRTDRSWTEDGPVAVVATGVADVGALLTFRRAGLRAGARRRLRIGAGLVLGLTVAAIVVPALLRAPLDGRRVGDLVAVLPSVYLGFAVLTVVAAISSGGGRELLPRDQAVAFPVSALTEHLGALVLAPLNVAWLIQAWALLGTTTYVLGPRHLAAAVVPLLLWIAVATAFGQLVGWGFEGLRRGPHGALVTRSIVAVVAAGGVGLVLGGRTTDLLDRSPTVEVYLAAAAATGGLWWHWLIAVLLLGGLLVLLALAGGIPARWALKRPQREELRLESGHREPGPNPRSDLAAMIRLDRASIWRAVPLRRGLLVLGLMPGAVALAGELTWDLVTILPGLVASGGALLFGVNTWCLDGAGALWRDSLPVDPKVAFLAKVVVLFEVLLVAGALTIALAAVRAGAPSSAELASVLLATIVVAAQVVATSLRWSVRSPYAVNLRSARATPAPPVVMAGYSARLAAKTTVVGLIFSGTSLAADWRAAALVAVPLLCWSAYRLVGTAEAWAHPVVRARVVATVSG